MATFITILFLALFFITVCIKGFFYSVGLFTTIVLLIGAILELSEYRDLKKDGDGGGTNS